MWNRMVKIIALGAVLTLAVSPAAEAGRNKPSRKVTRTETHPYSGFAGIFVEGSTASFCVSDTGCLALTPAPREKYLTLELADTNGTAVPFLVTVNGTNSAYCGSTDSPIW